MGYQRQYWRESLVRWSKHDVASFLAVIWLLSLFILYIYFKYLALQGSSGSAMAANLSIELFWVSLVIVIIAVLMITAITEWEYI
jgi:heme/copper-type cytochrome/quinol oxidase subunit 2